MKNNRNTEWALFLFGVVLIVLVIMLCAMSKGYADTLTVNSLYLQKDRVQYKYSHSLESESPEVSGIQRTDISDLDGLQVWVDTDVYEDAYGHVVSYVRVCTLKDGQRFSERKCVYLEFGK